MMRRAAATLLAACAAAGCGSAYDSTAAIPTSLIVRNGDAQTGTVASRLSLPVLVQVRDQNDQPASAVPVHFAATGASLGHATVLTNAAGDAETVVTLGTIAGTATVTATVTGIASPATFTLTATAGAAAAVIVLRGSGQTGAAGAALDSALVVRVNDANGNAVAGALVDWTSATGTFLTAVQTTSGADGTTSARLRLPTTSGVVTARATLHGTTAGATFTLTALPM